MTAVRHIAQRAAIALCAPGDRRWIEAMLAEARAAEHGGGFADARAVWSVAFASIGARLDAIMVAPLRWGVIVAAHVAIIGLALSRTEIEFHGIDDDVCLRIGAGAAAVVLTIVIGTLVAAMARPVTRRTIT